MYAVVALRTGGNRIPVLQCLECPVKRFFAYEKNKVNISVTGPCSTLTAVTE